MFSFLIHGSERSNLSWIRRSAPAYQQNQDTLVSLAEDAYLYHGKDQNYQNKGTDMVRLQHALLLCIALFLLIPVCIAEVTSPEIILSPSVHPGDDFYSYVNNAWMAAHKIPADKTSYTSLTELQETVESEILTLLERAAQSPPDGPDQNLQLLGQFYRSGMDTGTIEKERTTPLSDLLTMIATVSTRDDLTNCTVRLYEAGFGPVYSYYADVNPKNQDEMVATIDQRGLGLPDRDLYLENNMMIRPLQAAYRDHIRRLLVLSGVREDEAAAHALTIYQMEKTLAAAHSSLEENRDPAKTTNLYSSAELEEEFPAIGWEYLRSIPGSGPVTEVNVLQPRYLHQLNSLLETAPIEDWKIYLTYHLMNTAAPYLSSDYEMADHTFFTRVLQGGGEPKPRSDRVAFSTNYLLGDLVGIAYAAEYGDPEQIKKVTGIFHAIRQMMYDRIANLTWMSDAAKVASQDRLSQMGEKIGYPENLIDYSGLNLSGSYIGNVRSVLVFSQLHGPKGLDKIGKPVDRSIWFIPPQSSDAAYDASLHEMVIPAGVIRPPFFYPDADDAVNYGSIGAVIGHEIIHGFDSTGRRYELAGGRSDWWTFEDTRNYSALTDRLVDQYSSVQALPGVYIDGKRTLSENVADLGGLTLAYHAWKQNRTGTGTDDRQFFISFAHLWRGNYRDEEIRARVSTDDHVPGKYRVNGVVSNMPEFYDAFPEINPKDRLFREPDERLVIW